MKKFSAAMLILHALIEGVMGLLMVIAPHRLSPTAAESEQGIMMMYGFAALSLALLAAWFWPHRRNLAALAITLPTLATFHTGLTIGIALSVNGGAAAGIIFLHAAFAISFWALWRQRRLLAEPA